MNTYRTPFRVLSILLGVALLLLGAPGSRVAWAQGADGCECPRVVDSNGRPFKVPPGKQPVLLVHGFGLPGIPGPFGNPGEWNGDEGLAKKLEADPNYVVGRLDYSDIHANWITDGEDSIAKRVATAIKCMAANTKKKVASVGHSMGGLAIQAAMKDKGAADNTLGVISVGTPWKGVPRDKIEFLIGTAKSATMGLPPGAKHPAKAYVETIEQSTALQTMLNDGNGGASPKIKELEPIPGSIQVLPIAGDVQVDSWPAMQQSTVPAREKYPTDQQVNLVGTSVTLFDQKSAALRATDATPEEFDPLVGSSSALTPNGGWVLPSAPPVQCKSGKQCLLHHSQLPKSAGVADAARGPIEKWRGGGSLVDMSRMDPASASLGNCGSVPVPVGTPPPPKQPVPPKPKKTACASGKTYANGDCVPKEKKPKQSKKPEKKEDRDDSPPDPYDSGGSDPYGGDGVG